jgi:hypothetical protein
LRVAFRPTFLAPRRVTDAPRAFRTGFAARALVVFAFGFVDRFLVAELFFFADPDAGFFVDPGPNFAFRVVRFLAAPIAAPVSAPIAVPTTGAPTAVPATAPATAPPSVLPAVLVPVSAAPLSSSSMFVPPMLRETTLAFASLAVNKMARLCTAEEGHRKLSHVAAPRSAAEHCSAEKIDPLNWLPTPPPFCTAQAEEPRTVGHPHR